VCERVIGVCVLFGSRPMQHGCVCMCVCATCLVLGDAGLGGKRSNARDAVSVCVCVFVLACMSKIERIVGFVVNAFKFMVMSRPP
jgi:hypothetical protein